MAGKENKPAPERPRGQRVIYPFWLAVLVFNPQFLLNAGSLLLFWFVLFYLYLTVLPHRWPVLAGLGVLGFGVFLAFLVNWASKFLVTMIVDFDAENGNGLVTIKRALPHPTLPETIQIKLQHAAEGSPEVNTTGFFNTVITQVNWFRALRPLTFGDLTLRSPAIPKGITMFGIQNPAAVKKMLGDAWGIIDKDNKKKKEEKERVEQIDRMTIAVREGLKQAVTEGILQPLAAPAPEPVPPDDTPPPAADGHA